jgi:hypothetical protein
MTQRRDRIAGEKADLKAKVAELEKVVTKHAHKLALFRSETKSLWSLLRSTVSRLGAHESVEGCDRLMDDARPKFVELGTFE